MHGSDRCKTHSAGKATQFKPGVKNVNWKDGRYSKHLPIRMLETYQEALSDPELLDLRNAIALAEARITDILIRVDSGEAGQIWRNLKQAKYEYDRAPTKKQKEKAHQDLMLLLDQGYTDTLAWEELGRLMEQRRRLTETEAKRLQFMKQFVTLERMQVFIAKLQLILKDNITDQGVLNQIAKEIMKLQTFDDRVD